jgi:hypothetical protein
MSSRCLRRTNVEDKPELRAELRAARQQVGGVGQRREQRCRQTVVVNVSSKAQYPITVVEIGGIAAVEAGKGKVAGNASKLHVVLALESSQLSGVGVMKDKTGMAGKGG